MGELLAHPLQLTCHDEDLLKKDDFLGSATVDLRSLERQPKVSFDVKLSTQGTVVLRAGWGVTRDQAPGGAAAPASDITANARATFEHFGQEPIGFLDYRELKNALIHMRYDVSTRDAIELLRAYDDNPDGKLDVGEFSRLVADLNTRVGPTMPPMVSHHPWSPHHPTRARRRRPTTGRGVAAPASRRRRAMLRSAHD